jgi:hypothetical protein
MIDADGLTIGVLLATPNDEDWDREVTQEAANLMEEAADGIYNHVFSGTYYGTRREEKKQRKNGKPTPLDKKIPQRGPHRAESFGNLMGGGQETPRPFFHTILHQIVLAGLLATEPFQRIAGFTNCKFFYTFAASPCSNTHRHVPGICARPPRLLSHHLGKTSHSSRIYTK